MESPMTFDDTPHLNDYFVSTVQKDLELTWVVNSILGSYWGSWRTHEIIHESIKNSLCFGLYYNAGSRVRHQVGFARVVTDYSTFSWICDVFVDPKFRGKGLGKFLVNTIVNHRDIKKTVMLLRTKDASSFYTPHGFHTVEALRKIPDEPA